MGFGKAIGLRQSVIPGFGITFGVTLFWLGLIVLIPLAGLFLKSATLSWAELVNTLTGARVWAAFRLSFTTSLIAALINVPFGLILAWVLVRYRFPGRRVLDALVDVPFALPTAVAGIALTTLYAENGWIGSLLAPLGIQVSFTPAGIVVALIFIGLPFVVRTVQPVLEDLDPEVEEVAASLGASRLQTVWRIVLPALMPALLTGFALAFARALGEYGSVIFIAGNLPMVSEIVPLLIVIKLEEYAYAQATALAALMLVVSFAILLIINLIQRQARRHEERG